MITENFVKSFDELLRKTDSDFEGEQGTYPWFRGEPNKPLDKTKKPSELLPGLWRVKEDGCSHDENLLLQNFRMKAPIYGVGSYIPPRQGSTDEWLFLAQHFRLPTRLLDWTESLLIALYFALHEEQPVVWMLDPIGLNNLSIPPDERPNGYIFSLTWYPSPPKPPGAGNINIRGAWEQDKIGTDIPMAIMPTLINIRMSVQKSCFTIHGKRREPLSNLVDEPILNKYVIDPNRVHVFRDQLKLMGITHTTTFPDLEHLSLELSELF